jgi:heterodisulfide reductase subunit D
MQMNGLLEVIDTCTECDVCMEVCPTYKITDNALYSPKGRLQAAQRLFKEGKWDDSVIKGFYNCPKCMACETVCPENIEISKIVAAARNKVVALGKGPLVVHQNVIKGILGTGNSVNGDPAKRLEWLPESFTRQESDTLLYLGCLPSFLVKDAATYSYLVLKELDIDFMILEDEGCCGTYIYESGDVPLAKEYFMKNAERFFALGIRRLIVPCNGCFKCFKYFYPEVLGGVDFEVSHVVEAVFDVIKDKPDLLNKIDRQITYQDSCRLGRAEGITEQPRELLEMCGATVKELPMNREKTPCCGSGGGIRSAFKALSFSMAQDLLSGMETEALASPCPFCTFNLTYTNKKARMNKRVDYITKIVWESLES